MVFLQGTFKPTTGLISIANASTPARTQTVPATTSIAGGRTLFSPWYQAHIR